MNKRPTLYIDIDGVLVNFLKQYARFHKARTGQDVPWEQINDYKLARSMPTDRKYEYLYDPSFYSDIDFMPGAVETVNKLNSEGYDIRFITVAVTPESLIAKYELLRRTFPWFELENGWLLMPRKQHLIVPDSLIIDDNPHFFKESQFTYNVCFAWGHNRDVKDRVDLYTSDWSEIFKFIKRVTIEGDNEI